MSDLHREFRSDQNNPLDYFKPCAPNLIIAGDLGLPAANSRYKQFLLNCSKLFEKIFLILGNRDHYGWTLKETPERVKQLIADIPNVHLLHKSAYKFEHEDFVLLGCTLWSNVSKIAKWRVQSSIADYQKIYVSDAREKLISVDDLNAEHEDH